LKLILIFFSKLAKGFSEPNLLKNNSDYFTSEFGVYSSKLNQDLSDIQE